VRAVDKKNLKVTKEESKEIDDVASFVKLYTSIKKSYKRSQNEKFLLIPMEQQTLIF